MLREPYKGWAEGHIDRIRGILNGARDQHTEAVKERIESVQQMKDVVSITESLFALSKETAQLESEAFVQRQKVALAAEVKQVLDSWVRFEQQQKESEQADLVRSIIDKVTKDLADEKTQRDILNSAIAEVERAYNNVYQLLCSMTYRFPFPSSQNWSRRRLSKICRCSNLLKNRLDLAAKLILLYISEQILAAANVLSHLSMQL